MPISAWLLLHPLANDTLCIHQPWGPTPPLYIRAPVEGNTCTGTCLSACVHPSNSTPEASGRQCPWRTSCQYLSVAHSTPHGECLCGLLSYQVVAGLPSCPPGYALPAPPVPPPPPHVLWRGITAVDEPVFLVVFIYLIKSVREPQEHHSSHGKSYVETFCNRSFKIDSV